LLVRGRYTITFKREDEELPPWILPPVAVAVEEEEEEEEEVPDCEALIPDFPAPDRPLVCFPSGTSLTAEANARCRDIDKAPLPFSDIEGAAGIGCFESNLGMDTTFELRTFSPFCC